MRSRPFLVLYFAVLVGTMGISMVSPLLPVFAKDLGATGIWIGVTFSVFAITMTVMSPVGGRLSDRFGRKPFIVVGLLIYCVAVLGYLTATTFEQVIVFRALSGIGTGFVFAVARAYIADIVPPQHEGRWFGVFVTADIIGFGVGPLIAGVLREAAGFDSVFIAMAALMLASALIVATLLPRVPEAVRRAHAATPPPRAARLLDGLRDRLVLGLTLVMGFTSLSFGISFSFLAVRLEDEMAVGAALVGVTFAVQSFVSGLVQPASGWLADRVDRRGLAVVGLLLTAVTIAPLGALNTVVPTITLFVLAGVGIAIAFVAAAAMQVEAGRRVGMGTVQGLNSAGEGLGILVGSVGGGVMVELLGTDAAFYFGGTAIVLGTIAFAWLTRHERVSSGLAEAMPFAPIPEVAGGG